MRAALLLLVLAPLTVRAAEPTPLQYALSARLCGQLEHRADMKHRITSTLQEAKAHPGTVVDLRELASDQRSVREVEVAIADTRAAMRRARVRPVACTNPNVVVVEGCLGALIVGREASTAWWVHDDPELCTPGVKGAIAEARHALGELEP